MIGGILAGALVLAYAGHTYLLHRRLKVAALEEDVPGSAPPEPHTASRPEEVRTREASDLLLPLSGRGNQRMEDRPISPTKTHRRVRQRRRTARRRTEQKRNTVRHER